MLGQCIFWISLAYSIVTPTLFCSLSFVWVDKERNDEPFKLKWPFVLVGIAFVVAIILRFTVFSQKSEVRFK